MTAPLRIHVYVHSLGYLRFVDPVLRELVDRGHAIHLFFERDDHDPAEQSWLDEMSRHERFSWTLTKTLKYDAWRHYAMRIRSATDAARFYAPPFRDSGYLFERAEHRAPGWFRWIARGPLGRTDRGVRAMRRVLSTIEQAIPSSGALERELAQGDPDVLVLCPHPMPGMRSSDYTRAARVLGVRTVQLVASWDHLSSKQQLHEAPDRLVVWNETQVEEAMRLHGIDRDRIAVTGAQSFDHWFGWQPRARDKFCALVGLDPARPYVVYVGGSLFPAEITEAEWARRWVDEVRREPALASVGVLVRPHPNRGVEFSHVSFDELENVTVWPALHAEMPLDHASRADFFDSIHHSAAVFGLNTSAMIESAIVGRPVHTMFVPEFRASQRDVFHFDYLLRVGGGLVRVAETFDQLRAQLAQAVAGEDREADARRTSFLEEFVRPRGLDRPSTPAVADVIEEVAALGPATPARMPLRFWPLRLPLAVYVRIKPFFRRVRFKARLIAHSMGRG